jgi:Pyruvate/2-oxoacid:ferredoxin oxidoreductase delta subunit
VAAPVARTIGSSPAAAETRLRGHNRVHRPTGGKCEACQACLSICADQTMFFYGIITGIWVWHLDCICSGRPGSVQQQYRPRSPACVVPGSATNHAPVENAADTHTVPVNKGVYV